MYECCLSKFYRYTPLILPMKIRFLVMVSASSVRSYHSVLQLVYFQSITENIQLPRALGFLELKMYWGLKDRMSLL